MVIMWVWYMAEERQTDWWNRMESPDTIDALWELGLWPRHKTAKENCLAQSDAVSLWYSIANAWPRGIVEAQPPSPREGQLWSTSDSELPVSEWRFSLRLPYSPASPSSFVQPGFNPFPFSSTTWCWSQEFSLITFLHIISASESTSLVEYKLLWALYKTVGNSLVKLKMAKTYNFHSRSRCKYLSNSHPKIYSGVLDGKRWRCYQEGATWPSKVLEKTKLPQRVMKWEGCFC